MSDNASDKERLDRAINRASQARQVFTERLSKGNGATPEELEQLRQMQDYENSLLKERYGIDFEGA